MTALLFLWTLCVGSAAQTQLYHEIRGRLLPSVPMPQRLLWIPSHEDDEGGACALVNQASWSCRVLEGARGLVVFIQDDSVAYAPVGIAGPAAAAAWGRVIRVRPGGVSPDDLHDLQVTAWMPERSSVRRRAQRFKPTQDESILVLQLTETAFWIAGRNADSDSFVRIEGPAIGAARITVADLAAGPPDVPVFAAAQAPRDLAGFVQAADGRPVEDASIEITEPLGASALSIDQDPSTIPLIVRGATRTGHDGSFRFEQLVTGNYLLLAMHTSLGRGETLVTRLDEPAIIRLVAPIRAVGRVLRGGLPVDAVRVRFVPEASAWVASADPMRHIAEETMTGADGRFVLPLPPEPSGFVQFIAPDGTMTRVAVGSTGAAARTNELALGDVALPDPRRVILRVLDPAVCDMTATGPLGLLGLEVVHAAGEGSLLFLELPEPGDWALSAECAGRAVAVEPGIVSIPATGPDPVLDVRLVRSGGDS